MTILTQVRHSVPIADNENHQYSRGRATYQGRTFEGGWGAVAPPRKKKKEKKKEKKEKKEKREKKEKKEEKKKERKKGTTE